ncbi:MAG: Hydroxy/aromatic amino acid permease (HAAAP) family protein [Parcubacteria group bacterium GW2011_GWA2_45_30]|nr:MAG: Hydroxy/aromatic amino acid permease (HAAAP) family protein [Parcubacteria group bacterium GW2011_GWA2_45_30]
MFAIPYSFAAVGFWFGVLELVILTGVILLFQLLYGEVVLATPEFHRLPGYAQIYLGRYAVFLARFSALFGITGVLLAYILLGSKFMQTIFLQFGVGGGSLFWASVITLATALITFLPLRKEAAINGILTAVLIVFTILLSVFLLFFHFDASRLGGLNPFNAFIPYGVLLFALSGGAVIPDLVMVLGKERSSVRRAIIVGTLIPAALYFLFALAVVGTFGIGVSEETISSLGALDGGYLIFFGSLIGFLAAFTSFIVLGKSFQILLNLDFKFPRVLAWIIAVFFPFALYLAGMHDFIVIIGAVGAIAVGIDSALTIAMYHKIKQNTGSVFSTFSYVWKFGICAMIVVGVFYELSKTLW